MKKTLAVLAAIVFAAALVSCSLFETESEMGTVVIDLGGSARSADPLTGLPILGTDGVFTHIRIFNEANRELLFSVQNSASASVMFAVGTKITVHVDIVTDSARWHGEGVHTVGSGSNAVALKISKVPVSADKVLLWQKDSSNNTVFYAADEWMLHKFTDSQLPPVLADSAHLPEGLLTPNKPTDVFCFDRSGNLYIVFKEGLDYSLVKYEPLAGGGWDAQHTQIRNLHNSHVLTAVAVDSSDSANNRLYVAYEDGPNPHLDMYSFSETQFAALNSADGLQIDGKDPKTVFFDVPPNEMKIRALAADENGLFAVVETQAAVGVTNRDISVKHCSTNLTPKSGSMALFTNVNPAHVAADLCIKNGVLYAAGSLFEATFFEGIKRENFTRGKLWKLGQSSSFAFNSAQELWESFSDESAKQEGYAPCKFNTGKQNKLITASDGCYVKELTSPPTPVQKNAVLFFNIENGALIKRQNINTEFTKELIYRPAPLDIFEWK